MSNEQQDSTKPDNPTRSTRAHKRLGGRLPSKERQQKQETFLEVYAECGVIKYACKAAGINRSTFYDWQEHDQVFAEKLTTAKVDAIDTLEYAAYEQSVCGTEEYVVSMGQVVMKDGQPLTNRKHSPQLLITLLKANLPEKYKDRTQVDQNVNIDANGAKDLLMQKLEQMRGAND